MRPPLRDDAPSPGSAPVGFPLPRQPEPDGPGARAAVDLPLSEAELHVYARQIAALDADEERARRRFARMRTARVTLVGEGALLPRVLRAGLHAGWRQLAVTGYPPSLEQELTRLATQARRDPEQRVTLHGAASPGFLLARSELVVHLAELAETASEREPRAVARAALAESCAAHGVPLCQVTARPGEVWISPIGPAQCGALALQERLGVVGGRSGGGAPAEGLAPLVAQHVVQECVRHLTAEPEGCAVRPWWARAEAVRVDAASLACSRHVVPAVRAREGESAGQEPSCAQEELAAWLATAPVPEGETRRGTELLVDARTGVLAEVRGISPVAERPRCQAVLRTPTRPTATVTAASGQAAWEGAVLQALAGFAATLPVRGRLSSEGPVWGWDLAAQRPRTLPPGPLVPPHPVQPAQPFPPAGVAGGRSVAEALEAGVYSLAEQVVCTLLAGGSGAFPQLAVDEGCGALWQAVTQGAEAVTVHDLGGVLGLPTVGVAHGSRLTALRCAEGTAPAARGALELALTAREFGAPAGRRPALLPRTGAAVTHATSQACTEPRRPEVPDAEHPAVRALARAGLAPVALPLHGDAAVAAAAPHLVRVVLLDGVEAP